MHMSRNGWGETLETAGRLEAAAPDADGSEKASFEFPAAGV
jgi:hypothetical protein